MTEYFPEEKEDEDATFIVSSFKILRVNDNGIEVGEYGHGMVVSGEISLAANKEQRRHTQQIFWSYL